MTILFDLNTFFSLNRLLNYTSILLFISESRVNYIRLRYALFYCMFMSAAIHGSTVGRRFIPSAEERRNKNELKRPGLVYKN